MLVRALQLRAAIDWACWKYKLDGDALDSTEWDQLNSLLAVEAIECLKSWLRKNNISWLDIEVEAMVQQIAKEDKEIERLEASAN